ncbi:helix-turn-helix transcriptional regulator [Pedobacter sp. SYP-B3415]|uniref:helix-turn-helix transcriptional regulator n=1 Tax=Pedobacter sp. SYP-B3415 TaxID=2496641 RepID=UPI00101D9753|nr:helix-turn-helix transcriptional regulator [Pedobacter sp. SYP-B3415]
MTINRIPGGLVKGGEFLSLDDRPKFITDGIMRDLADSPAYALDLLRKSMNSQPKVEAAIEKMVGTDDQAKLERFTMCQFGALNTDPDICENGTLSAPEYVPCRHRGSCEFEGIACSAIMVRSGIFLTKTEMDVAKLAILPDRIISIELGMAEMTVKTHWKNIRLKMGLQSKGEIIHWLTQRGII